MYKRYLLWIENLWTQSGYLPTEQNFSTTIALIHCLRPKHQEAHDSCTRKNYLSHCVSNQLSYDTLPWREWPCKDMIRQSTCQGYIQSVTSRIKPSTSVKVARISWHISSVEFIQVCTLMRCRYVSLSSACYMQVKIVGQVRWPPFTGLERSIER